MLSVGCKCRQIGKSFDLKRKCLKYLTNPRTCEESVFTEDGKKLSQKELLGYCPEETQFSAID